MSEVPSIKIHKSVYFDYFDCFLFSFSIKLAKTLMTSAAMIIITMLKHFWGASLFSSPKLLSVYLFINLFVPIIIGTTVVELKIMTLYPSAIRCVKKHRAS